MLSKKESKLIQSLKIKKYRSREKLFLVEGQKNISELLTSTLDIELIVATPAYSQNIVDPSTHRIETVTQDQLSKLGTLKTNDAALAVVRQKRQSPFEYTNKQPLFVLDGVGDPGNLGTIIRTLDWFGFTQLLCSQECADFYNPKTIASTMGSFTRVDVHYAKLEEVLHGLNAPIYGASMDGESLYETKIPSHAAIVMGSESHGIGAEIQKMLTHKITIPKKGKAESLNVAIAAGIIAGHLRMD